MDTRAFPHSHPFFARHAKAALLAAGLAVATVTATAQTTPPATTPAAPETTTQAPAKPATPVGADDLPDAPSASPAAVVPTGPTVVMDTSMGRLTCKLFDKQAPLAVANFIGLAEGSKDWIDPKTHQKMRHKPYYDGTIFHRVIPNFMAQGGDPTGTGMGDPGFTFNDEFDPNLNFDVPGRLAMANSGPNTNGSQFFVTEQPYESLNQHYTIFGQCDPSSVVTVQTITRVERDSSDRPLTPVVLKKVIVVRDGEAIPPPSADAGTTDAKPTPKP